MTGQHRMPSDQTNPKALPKAASLRAIFDDRYVLLLAVRPGDETIACGGFIAESCARGRPPFVCVVTDGSSEATDAGSADPVAQRRAGASRAATALLDLPDERLLLFGLYDGSVPQADARFEQLVRAVADLARRYDCDVLCAPFRSRAQGDDLAVARLARAVATRAGLRLMWYATPTGTAAAAAETGTDHGGGHQLDITAHAAKKHAAVHTLSARGPQPGTGDPPPAMTGAEHLTELFWVEAPPDGAAPA